MGKVALITCGESVKRSWNDDKRREYDHIVGVNWAAHHYDLDWVVAWDAQIWRHGEIIIPRTGAVSYGDGIPDDVDAIRIRHGIEWELIDEPLLNERGQMNTFSFPLAVQFCVQEWPDCSIDIYGLDMDEKQGICMWSNGHKSERWDRERSFVECMLNKYADRISLVDCRYRK